MTGIAVLGSTGSIGTQTLDICSRLGLKVTALAANSNIELLETQARRFKPPLVSVAREDLANDLRVRLSDTGTKVIGGESGLIECAAHESASHIMCAMVGMAGLAPTLAAIEARKTIALANKETLMCAGSVVMKRARDCGVSILPVDSEHSAIFQCLQGLDSKQEVKKLWLTASGGSLYGYTHEQLQSVNPDTVLKHPNWNMGRKVTVDSATMFNKGMECVEAYHLFGLSLDSIGVVIHRQSIVHSMVELVDGAVLAQCGVPDMRLPIQYALTFPKRAASPVQPLDFTKASSWTFEPAAGYECLDLVLEAAKRGDAACCAVNAADEIAVARFLNEEIGFIEIPKILKRGLELAEEYDSPDMTVEDLIELDREVKLLYRGNI